MASTPTVEELLRDLEILRQMPSVREAHPEIYKNIPVLPSVPRSFKGFDQHRRDLGYGPPFGYKEPLTITPPSPHQFRESANLAQIGAPEAMLAQLPEGVIKPFVRSPSPQSSIFSGGKYSNSPLNRIANLNVPLSNKENNMPAPMYPTLPNQLSQKDRGNLYQQSRWGFGGPNDALTRFQDNRRDHIKNYGINPGAAGNVDMSGIDFGGETFMGGDAISRAMAEQGIGGYDPLKMAGENISFGLGGVGGAPPTEKETDWLGWAGAGTGLLSGVGGILDYFNNKKGLALTEDAINRKYAAFDREYLARANTADNILAGRKRHIEKTHADPDSSHLQYINRANA